MPGKRLRRPCRCSRPPAIRKRPCRWRRSSSIRSTTSQLEAIGAELNIFLADKSRAQNAASACWSKSGTASRRSRRSPPDRRRSAPTACRRSCRPSLATASRDPNARVAVEAMYAFGALAERNAACRSSGRPRAVRADSRGVHWRDRSDAAARGDPGDRARVRQPAWTMRRSRKRSATRSSRRSTIVSRRSSRRRCGRSA